MARTMQDTVEAATRRMKSLHQNAGLPPVYQGGVLHQTFEELQTALEELNVAMEELRQQNEALSDAQQRILAEHARYVDLFNFAPDAYFITDCLGIIREANAAASVLTGVSQQFLHGRPLANHIAEQDREAFRRSLTRFGAGIYDQRHSMSVRLRDGGLAPVDVSASLAPGADGATAIRWLMRDATAVREAERLRTLRVRDEAVFDEMQRSYSQIAHMIEDMNEAFFHLDRHECVAIANTHCLHLWRKTSVDVIGQPLLRILPDLAESQTLRQVRQALTGRESARFEAPSGLLDGCAEVNVYPVLDGVGVTFRDVVNRKKRRSKIDREQERDRRVSQALQDVILSTGVPRDFGDLEIGSALEPVWADSLVGGDTYDVIRSISQNTVALIVGDVVGKGVGTAACAMEMRYALRMFLSETKQPSEALFRLNNYVCNQRVENNELSGRMLAVGLVVIDLSSYTVRVARAGSEPLLLLKLSGNTLHLGCESILIGVEPNTVFAERESIIDPGDRLVLFTDGLTEARDPDGRFFGLDGVLRVMEGIEPAESAQCTAKRLRQAIGEFTKGVPHDDICLLVARRSGCRQ